MKKIISILTFIILNGLILVANDEINKSDTELSNKCGVFCNHPNDTQLWDKQTNVFQADERQTSVVSPKQRFRIHYDTMGFHTVSPIDKDKNGIPDYIDSVCAVFDYVFEVEVVEMGMRRPYSAANDELYNVYVLELNGTSFYGDCNPNGSFTVAGEPFTKHYSYIRIDNNYSEQDTFTNSNGKPVKKYTTTDIDGVRVTAAHEFNHSITFVYGEPLSYSSAIWEMSATCMEMIVYPDLHDYLQYVNAMLADWSRFIFGEGGEPMNGYPFCTFFYMMTENLDKMLKKSIGNMLQKETIAMKHSKNSLKKKIPHSQLNGKSL